MSYCCFSSVMQMLLRNIKAFNYTSQYDVVENYIFPTFKKQFGGICKDNSTVSRWVKGEIPLSKEIGQYYSDDKSRLYADMKVYADNSADFYKAVEEIKELVDEVLYGRIVEDQYEVIQGQNITREHELNE